MPNTIMTTMRKWNAVHRALQQAERGRMRGTYEVRRHNSPVYQEVYGHYNNAFSNNQNNTTFGATHRPAVLVYFIQHRNRRNNLAAAYNKLNAMARELAMVRRKAVATSTLQRHWRRARPGIVNNRKTATLLTLKRTPGVPNTRRKTFENAFPKPVYGPNNEITTLRKMIKRKYNRY
jgi:hypothetical protein